MFLHAVGGVVEGLYGSAVLRWCGCVCVFLICCFYFWVVDLQTAIEHSGFAEDDVGCAHFVGFADEFESLKPYKFYPACAVAEASDDAFVVSFADFFHLCDLSAELHVWHVAVDFADAVDFAAVNVSVGVVAEHVGHGLYTDFFF